ncbi:16978_t:CDS:2, partial [Funneliformis geosporum]
KVTVIHEEKKEDEVSEQDFTTSGSTTPVEKEGTGIRETLTLAILASKGRGNIRYRKGLLLVNLSGKDIQQKFLLASEKKALEEKVNDLLVKSANPENCLEELKNSAEEKLDLLKKALQNVEDELDEMAAVQAFEVSYELA